MSTCSEDLLVVMELLTYSFKLLKFHLLKKSKKTVISQLSAWVHIKLLDQYWFKNYREANCDNTVIWKWRVMAEKKFSKLIFWFYSLYISTTTRDGKNMFFLI